MVGLAQIGMPRHCHVCKQSEESSHPMPWNLYIGHGNQGICPAAPD